MQVDAHQHFWRLERGDYDWLSAAGHPAIYRDFGPNDLAPLMAAAGVERTMLVQAAPTLEETRFLLQLAGTTGFVAGVVGWADLESPSAAETVAELARDPKLVGLRPMLQDLEDDAWILRPALTPAFAAMARARLRLDALVMPRHLPHLARFIAANPELPVVIDHGAKPDIARGDIAGWRGDLTEIAGSTSACCKLSGLVTEAGSGWSADQLKPYVDVLVDAFGPDRLMWGSDWPVVNEGGGYQAWRAAAEALTSHLGSDDRAAIFGRTAASFYGVTP